MASDADAFRLLQSFLRSWATVWSEPPGSAMSLCTRMKRSTWHACTRRPAPARPIYARSSPVCETRSLNPIHQITAECRERPYFSMSDHG
jgi:hypothetical protein